MNRTQFEAIAPILRRHDTIGFGCGPTGRTTAAIRQLTMAMDRISRNVGPPAMNRDQLYDAVSVLWATSRIGMWLT